MYPADEVRQKAKHIAVTLINSSGANNFPLKTRGMKTKPFLIHWVGLKSFRIAFREFI